MFLQKNIDKGDQTSSLQMSIKVKIFLFFILKECCCINFEFKTTYQFLQKILHK